MVKVSYLRGGGPGKGPRLLGGQGTKINHYTLNIIVNNYTIHILNQVEVFLKMLRNLTWFQRRWRSRRDG